MGGEAGDGDLAWGEAGGGDLGVGGRLMNAFLSRDASPSANSDHLIRKLAGQALAMLAIESADNCSAMLKEPGYVFIKELTIMIRDVRYRYVAANLLRNLCVHARPELSNSDLRELYHALREVSLE